MANTPPPLGPRFWAKVQKSTDPNGCWAWTAHRRFGYGGITINKRVYLAHRLMLAAKLGRDLLPDMEACHACDNRACVNPNHLWEGTRSANVLDAVGKGRWVNNRGERQGAAKLTEAIVVAIRSARGSQRLIGQRFGVGQSHVSRIRSGQRWAHLQQQHPTMEDIRGE
jgi:HNH endonuclease